MSMREAEIANSLGLENTHFDLGGDIDSDDDLPVRSPAAKGASYSSSAAPAGAVSLGRSTGGGGAFGHAAGKAGGGEGSGASFRALAQLAEQVQQLEAELAAATSRVEGNAGMLKLQLANYKKRVVEELRAKDRVIEEAAATNPALSDRLQRAQKSTEAMERAGPSLEPSLDAAPEALRGEVIRLRAELTARTAAERCVRIKARAARALAAELAAAMASVRASGAMEPGGPSTLLASLDRYTASAASAARAAGAAEEDFDYEAGGGGGGGGSGAGATGDGQGRARGTPAESAAALASALAALESEKAAAAILFANLARAQGEAARAKEEASVLREKHATLRGTVEAGQAAMAEAARRGAEKNSQAASSIAEQERLEREVARLTEELESSRLALDSTRTKSTAARGESEDLSAAVVRERDLARAEALAAREKAAREAKEAGEARAREAAVRADVASLRGELEALKAGESAAESRAAAGSASAAEAAINLEAERARSASAEAAAAAAEAALSEAKAKAKADKEKLKRNATAQFDDLKAKALEEIERERSAGEARAAALKAECAALTAALAAARGTLVPAAQRSARSAEALRVCHSGLKRAVGQGLSGFSAALSSFSAEVLGAMRRAMEGSAGLLERYKKEMKERRRLFNLVQELRGNIRVYCRIRPVFPAEAAAGERDVTGFPGEGELSIVSSKRAVKTFELDAIFRPDVPTEAVYREVEGLVQSTLDGYNVCIFAYGQTGSGKTFTMEGNPANPGINYRSLDSLFALRDERARDGWAFTISVSLLEIYNEEILDMLAERAADGSALGGKLVVRESKEGMTVPGLAMEGVTCSEDVVAIMKRGYRNRTTFATNMNEHSSRSHAMLSVYVRASHATSGTTQLGKLHLVDLAGSERLSRSGAAGDRMKEAQCINSSLSALGDVIMARAQKAKHTPFRNSTLTFLLSDSLSNDSKTLMFANMSPLASDADETICTLNFASRVRTVELGKASKHVSHSGGAEGE